MPPIWRGMDRAALDRDYNARASVPDYAAEARRYIETSRAARARLRMVPDLVYDPISGNTLDLFPGRPGGPLFLWIHGGYWRALSKADNHCVAPGLVARGAHVAVMDYTLVPHADLDEIVRQVRAASAFCARSLAEWQAGALYVGGSSAGGHLTGMVLAGGWHGQFGLAPDVVRGGIPVSGLFDLEPVRLSHVNDWMGLDAAAARRNSPCNSIPSGPAPPILASYGGLETSEFRRQTHAFAAAWQRAGHQAEIAPQATRNHFDIVVALGEQADPLCRHVAGFMRL